MSLWPMRPKIEGLRWLMNATDRLRRDIENMFPDDKETNKLATDLLYKITWKLADEEKTED